MSRSEARLVGGRYQLVEPIGRGGMGVVWRAHDQLLDRAVAVKEVRFDSAMGDELSDLNRRTMREARAAGRLTHPNVVVVHDVIEEDRRPWIIMQLVQSRSLGQVIREDGPLPPERTVEIGLPLLDALRAAHRQGVLHRDVKPENVLVTDDGRVVLTDFGIARLEADNTMTRTGLVGTPAFIAPERLRGAPAQRESDLWSLGATLYTAVEGKPPHDRGMAMATMHAVLNEEPAPARRAGRLGPVLMRMLAKEPADRPGYDETARLLRQASADHAPVLRQPGPPAVSPAPPVPRPAPDAGPPVPRPAQDAGPRARPGGSPPRAPAPRGGAAPGRPAPGGAPQPAGGASGGEVPGGVSADGAAAQPRAASRAEAPPRPRVAGDGKSAAASEGKGSAGTGGTGAAGSGGRAPAGSGKPAPAPKSGTKAASAAPSSKPGTAAGAKAPGRDAAAAAVGGAAGGAAASPSKTAGSTTGDGAAASSPAASPDGSSPGKAGPGPASRDASRDASPGAVGADDPGPAEITSPIPVVQDDAPSPGTDGTASEPVDGTAGKPAEPGAESPAGPAGDGAAASTSTPGVPRSRSPYPVPVTGAQTPQPARKSPPAGTGHDGRTKIQPKAGIQPDAGRDGHTRVERGTAPAAAEAASAASPAEPLGVPTQRSGVWRGDTATGPVERRPSSMAKAALVLVPALLLVAGVAGYLGLRQGENGSAGPGASTASAGGSAPATNAASEPAASGAPSATASGEGSASPSPSSSPSPTTSQPADAPDGWHRYKDDSGFSVALPKGWKVSKRQDTAVWFRGPGSPGFLLIDQTNSPQKDAVKDWKSQEKSRRYTYPGYTRVKIKSVDYWDEAADWEFTYNSGSTRTHVVNRGFVTSKHHGYAIFWSTPDSRWDKDHHFFETFTATFKPAK